MFVLFTDFGRSGPYLGQMRAVLDQLAPDQKVVDLFADAPVFQPKYSAYLLAAYTAWFPAGSIFLAVVDPGVGSDRPALAVEAEGKWFVGPGNGIFELVARRARHATFYALPQVASSAAASFHGRDLFAPAAARIALGNHQGLSPVQPPPGPWNTWPDDLPKIVYVDHFGNGMTGLRGQSLNHQSVLRVGETRLSHARVFSDVPVGQGFWYINANGLVEIAVNQGRADTKLGVTVGTAVTIEHLP